MCKVSVIVPIIVDCSCFEACLKSLINQTLRDVEIICINAVDEKMSQLLENYKNDYDNITVINQFNSNLSYMLNAGREAASGKYIYFMQSNEILIATALEELWEICEKKQLDVLLFSGILLESNNVNDETTYLIRGKNYPILSGKELLFKMYENDNHMIPLNLQFIKHDFLNAHKLCFETGDLLGGNLFGFNVLKNAKRVTCVPEIFLYCRMINPQEVLKPNKLVEVENELANLRKSFHDMENSVSFKVGRIMTAIPRKIRDITKKRRSILK